MPNEEPGGSNIVETEDTSAVNSAIVPVRSIILILFNVSLICLQDI